MTALDVGGLWEAKWCCKLQLLGPVPAPFCLLRSWGGQTAQASSEHWVWQDLSLSTEWPRWVAQSGKHTGHTQSQICCSWLHTAKPRCGLCHCHEASYLLFPSIRGNDCFLPWFLRDCLCRAAVSASVRAVLRDGRDAVLQWAHHTCGRSM